jgi:uncharacterized protein YeaO (DUF488 family)
MSEVRDTLNQLAAITDAALFERLAAAVLRAADTAKYGNISHPGVNPASGKTVKAPFDNVGWVESAVGSRFVCAAHTTCEQSSLRSKWLHDPSSVKPRTKSGKPTQDAGDLVKGLILVAEMRVDMPQLRVTFALTTNRETPFDVRVDAESLAAGADVELDVWSASRIAQFLDTSAEGQVIRASYLGTRIELISMGLLLEIGRRSLSDHLKLPPPAEVVARREFSLLGKHTLVVGSSGMGKTTVCARAAVDYLASGRPAIVLKHELLGASTTLAGALEQELRRQHPNLAEGAGAQALAICTDASPLLVLVEDINRSDQPGALLNKLISWASRAPAGQAEANWRLVCPVWPRFVDSLENKHDALGALDIVRLGRYDEEEARAAVSARSETLGRDLDTNSIAAIAASLANDPLLIALHDLRGETTASVVIERYVDEKTAELAVGANLLASEVAAVIDSLVEHMLHGRNVSPSWEQARAWLADAEQAQVLRGVLHDGRVLWLNETGRIEARHDRIMSFLISRVAGQRLAAGDLSRDYLGDPFFAESVGAAAARVRLPVASLHQLSHFSPAVAFSALKVASEASSSYEETAAKAAREWLERPETHSEHFVTRRLAVATVLAEIRSAHIVPLTDLFPRQDHRWYPLLAARLRNGDVAAGVTMLSVYGLGRAFAGQRELLQEVSRLYGGRLKAAVAEILERPDVAAATRKGALHLAGYLADETLAPAICRSWSHDEARNLPLYLWAAARCCGREAETTLGPVCDAWEALPNEEDAKYGRPVEQLAAYEVAQAFALNTPEQGVAYFVQRASTSPRLTWPITYMLRGVDHPDAVEHVVRYLAEHEKLDVLLSFSSMDYLWKELGEPRPRQMSARTKERLLALAFDARNDEHLQKSAFDLWQLSISESDVGIARSVKFESPLYEQAIWVRARRKDTTVVPALVAKIAQNPEYWLGMSRYVWTSELTPALAGALEYIASKGSAGEMKWGESTVAEWLESTAAEMLVRLGAEVAESLMAPLWARLKSRRPFVHAAVLFATTRFKALVQDAVDSSENPGGLFEYFILHAKSWTPQRPAGISRLEQMEALRPYLQLIHPTEIVSLWCACTQNGWLEFRTQYLDELVRRVPDRMAYLPEDTVGTYQLDKALAGQRLSIHEWIDWNTQLGATRASVLGAALQWLAAHDSTEALRLVADIFANEGTREELKLLEAAASGRPDSHRILSATRFNVFQRRLA